MVLSKPEYVEELIKRILTTNPPPASKPLNLSSIRQKKETGIYELLSKIEPVKTEIAPTTNILPKDIIQHFAKLYKQKFKSTYKITYRSDLPIVTTIQKFMASSGLQKNEWSIKFMDWCFEKSTLITKQNDYFTLAILPRYLNQFFQEVILPSVEKDEVVRNYHDESLLKEITDAEQKGRGTEILVQYGLPVSFTYFINKKGYTEEQVYNLVSDRFNKMIQNQKIEGKAKLENIFKSSILGSPYPKEFACLDWRNKFSTLTDLFKNEDWWRDEDYRGNAMGKYHAFLTEK